jgi:DNA processing protein
MVYTKYMKKTVHPSGDFSMHPNNPSRGPRDFSYGRIATISLDNPKYPGLLREIPDPPNMIFVRGIGTKINLVKTIAIVGTRRITEYGRQVTQKLVTDLVKMGFTIVSGMAIGVDTVAHWAAIAAGGKTIAVLGCGIDIIAPSGNTDLYWDIVRGHGAVISEIPPGFTTGKKQFVTRNRIISGLSLGVVVVEGTDHSGTLITAKYAADQGREVFAVPGPITSANSRAASILLKNGAKLVESADDIIEEIRYE